MVETKDLDHHLIEIPADGDHHKKLITAIQDHPLMEISDSPGHLLLLRPLQREENLPGCKIAGKERRLDTLKREVFQLCLLFFAFHGLFLTILFGSSSDDLGVSVCRKWWIPMITSLSFCLFLFQIDGRSSHRSPAFPFRFRFQVWVWIKFGFRVTQFRFSLGLESDLVRVGSTVIVTMVPAGSGNGG
ncbi:hypothetical protein Hdeb2414_s0009g00318411 [Helianthus debilis subsp. tardiflorus]